MKIQAKTIVEKSQTVKYQFSIASQTDPKLAYQQILDTTLNHDSTGYMPTQPHQPVYKNILDPIFLADNRETDVLRSKIFSKGIYLY